MQVNINFLEEESVLKVINFYNSAQSDKFQTNNRSYEEFNWLFLKGCYKPSLYVVVTDSETDEIIGTNAGIFIPMLSKNGELILTVKGEDTLLSLDKMIGLGKRDILKELLQAVEEKSIADGAVFIWGLTPAKAAFLRCGFRIITQIKGSFYVIKPLEFFKIQISKFPQLTFCRKMQLLVFAWYNFFNIILKFSCSGEYSYKRISFNEIEEKVLLSFLQENSYTTYLTKAFLKWRISENPSPLKYGCLEFRDKKDTVVAYFIFSSNSENIFFVEQFLFTRKFPDKKKIRIMRLAFNYCRKLNAVMIRAIGFSHNNLNINEMKLFTKAGFYFFNNPEESYLVFKNLSRYDIDPGDIYFSRLNTQGIG
jgi:hypothetical protein